MHSFSAPGWKEERRRSSLRNSLNEADGTAVVELRILSGQMGAEEFSADAADLVVVLALAVGFADLLIECQHGGLRLAKPAREIVVGDVVRSMEPDLGLVRCLQPEGRLCRITPSCRLRTAMQEAQRAFLAALDEYTLADLVAKKKPLGGCCRLWMEWEGRFRRRLSGAV